MKPFNYKLNDQDEITRLEQVKAFLEECKLLNYFDTFVNEGFDSLLSLFDITESDLIALNVKRGHRRVIQRAIATARGIPITTPIVIYFGYEEPFIAHMPKPGTTTKSITTTTYITSNKRCRHGRKKRKQYVPSKPVKPFDEYLFQVKEELIGLSIEEIKIIAKERWNSLNPIEKEKYEREALHANSDYVMDKFLQEEEDDDDSDKSQDIIPN